MTDDSKCDSPKTGVKGIRGVSQLTERCDGYEGGRWTVVMKCDRRCVGWWGGVMVMGRSKGLEEVHHLTESVTVIREV